MGCGLRKQPIDTIPLGGLSSGFHPIVQVFTKPPPPPPKFAEPSWVARMDKTSEACYRCYLIMEILRATGEKEFPLQLASCFFYIASHDGCLQEDVIEFTKLSSSSVSRNVTWLGAHHRLSHRRGLMLVRRERDLKDYKKYRCFLTSKGQQVANLVGQHMSMSLSNFEASARKLMTMEDDD